MMCPIPLYIIILHMYTYTRTHHIHVGTMHPKKKKKWKRKKGKKCILVNMHSDQNMKALIHSFIECWMFAARTERNWCTDEYIFIDINKCRRDEHHHQSSLVHCHCVHWLHVHVCDQVCHVWVWIGCGVKVINMHVERLYSLITLKWWEIIMLREKYKKSNICLLNWITPSDIHLNSVDLIDLIVS